MAAREGMKLQKKAQRVTEKMRDGVYTAPAPAGGVQGGAQAVQFQRKFDAQDKFDDEMNMKMQLMDDEGMTPFGQVFYDDKVGRWLERKEAANEAANFDKYFNVNFNKNDLASRQWAQQLHPEFYRAREQEMNERADTVLKLKKIQLRGPQDEEDLHMLYLIESGKVELPYDWDRIGAGFSGDSNEFDDYVEKKGERNFLRGLIRMPLFLTMKQESRRAEQNKNVGAWGNPNNPLFSSGPEEINKVRTRKNQPLSQPGRKPQNKTMGYNMVEFLRAR